MHHTGHNARRMALRVAFGFERSAKLNVASLHGRFADERLQILDFLSENI